MLCDYPKHRNKTLGQITPQPYDLLMRLICDERDRLWSAYTAAVRSYSRAKHALSKLPHTESLFKDLEQANKAVETYRSAMRKHCIEHGCDPDWLKEFGNK